MVMTGEVATIILQHTRSIRSDIGAMQSDMAGLRAEMLIMRHHMAGLLGAPNPAPPGDRGHQDAAWKDRKASGVDLLILGAR